MSLHAVLGIAAGAFSFAAYPIYIRDILRGNTKPSRVTWWVLALLNGALTITYYSSGARDTIWIPISYTIGFSVVALLSLRYGEGGWERSDSVCLGGAAVSIAVWYVFHSAEAALYLIILTDFVGLLPTLIKAYKRPWTESKASWSVAFTASLLNILAIETWNPAVSSYPIYVAATNAIILTCILFPRRGECTDV